MNRCQLCGNSLESNRFLHKTCNQMLFGTNYLPEIDLTLSEISIKAQQMTGKLSISGVQPKLSIKLNKETKQLEIVATGGEYILKPQTLTFPYIPQNENLCMTIASQLGINVPPHSLIKLKDNNWAYIVKRFDRIQENKIHQEDFWQILVKKDKYLGSHEEIGKKLIEISEIPGLDIQLFYARVVFNFIIGNGDAHLKNFSITYDKTGQVRLSPAYDIVSSKLVIPQEEDFALSINGKKNKITRKDFDILAEYLRIPKRISQQRFFGYNKTIKSLINDSLLPKKYKTTLTEIVTERFSRLNK